MTRQHQELLALGATIQTNHYPNLVVTEDEVAVRGGTTVCFIDLPWLEITSIARCNPIDTFSPRIGEAVAVGRTYKWLMSEGLI